MTQCASCLELMSQSLDSQLSPHQQQSLQAHLEECPQCRVLYRQLRQIHEEFSSWEEEEVPQGFAQGVMERIRALEAPAAKPSRVIPLWKRPLVRTLGSVAACAALCVGLWRAYTPQDEVRPISDPQPKYAVSQIVPQPAAESAPLQPELPQSSHQLLDAIASRTGSAPGTVLMLEEIPENLDGIWFRCDEELTFLLVDTDQPQQVIHQLSPQARYQLQGEGEDLILILLKE